MKRLINTAFISLFIFLMAGYIMAEDMMEKANMPCVEEARPCPMYEKMMQEKGEMKGKMMCPMCRMMSEGKMCPMHEKMMQQMHGGMMGMGDKPIMEGKMMCPMCKMMGDKGMMEGKMCPMHEKMMQQMHGGMMGMGDKPMMGGMGMMRGMDSDMMPGLHEMIFQLDLSKEQHEQINNFFNHHREEMERLQSERQNAKMELNEISRQDMPDLRHVREVVQRIADLEADMKYSQFRTMVDAKSVLKEEQRANLRRKMEGMHSDKPMPKKEKPDMPGREM